MTTRERLSMSDIVGRYEDQLLPEWIRHQLATATFRRELLPADELEAQSRRFLGAFRKVLQNGGGDEDITGPAWRSRPASC